MERLWRSAGAGGGFLCCSSAAGSGLQEVWTAPKAWVSPAWPLPQPEHMMDTVGQGQDGVRELSVCPGAAGGAKGRAPALGSRRLRGAAGQPGCFLSLPGQGWAEGRC